MRVRIEKKEQKRPKQLKKYLRNDQNKSELVKFLLQDWSHPTCYAHLFPSAIILFFNCGSQFFRLSLKDGLTECVSELVCDQDRLKKSALVYQAHRSTWSLSCLYFNSGFRYCNIRCILLCKYRFLCISRLVQVIDEVA